MSEMPPGAPLQDPVHSTLAHERMKRVFQGQSRRRFSHSSNNATNSCSIIISIVVVQRGVQEAILDPLMYVRQLQENDIVFVASNCFTVKKPKMASTFTMRQPAALVPFEGHEM